MHAWSGESGDVMGPAVTRTASAKGNTPPLKNGNDLQDSGYLIAVGSRTARFRRRYKTKIMLLILLILLLLLLCLAIVMTVLYVKQKRHKAIRICESKECLRSAANLALSMDKTANPCDDFYKYVCGNWANDHPRPDSYSSYDWFRDKETKVYTIVRDFLNRNISYQPKPVHQAKDMFTACMDTDTLDALGVKPVLTILNSLGLPPYPTFLNLTDDMDYKTYNFNWLEVVTKVKVQLGMDILIGFDIFTDPKNSTVYRLVMGSPETTNPFPSSHNEKKRHTGRKNFHNDPTDVINRLLLLNFDRPTKANKNSNDEEKIAQVHKLYYAEIIKVMVEASGVKTKLTENEIIDNILSAAEMYYNTNEDMYDLESDNSTESTDDDLYLDIPEYTVSEIQAHTDMIVQDNNGTATPIWEKYLEGVFNISEVTLDFENDKVMVSEPDLKYMSLMAAYVANTPPVLLELYIWVVEVMSIHTTTELRTLFYRVYDQTHTTADSGHPSRSLQCANAVNDMLGMAIAYAIADPHFLNVTKPKVERMLYEMKNALAHLVGKAKWMDDNTKVATYQKIMDMKTLIGFPDWLLEEGKLEEFYKGIKIDLKKHLDNMINIIRVKIKSALNKFREGHNFTWATDPTEVNAYHTFQENTITVPMVMLQYPFFDLGLDSLNYGSLGTVLGHEITHGFDNYGRQFDKNGNLLPWWSNQTIESFVNMTQCFIDQYSTYYMPEVDEHVDGKKTLGENIADNGGLREAIAALKEHVSKYGPEEKLPGFEHMTFEQLFFLSFGNLWCGVSTRDSLKADLDDEHSPQQFRAQGALQNNEDFARVWHCPPGSKMNPSKRCIIF
ncbi:hypothetical protein K1T71_008442 [Dendrolimus kikuchii]|uniref:Uncharacterized protein n=1 Tax=Dendrolimus kikuchii TaxID=765133 RepID=A0ACC1CX94_9NEOP|nr:hypothetical protein K1T71_008442 [Dendrolimus kikuchii]